MQTKKIVYWGITGLLCAFISFSAFLKLSGNPEVLTGFAHVQYPASLALLLGVLMLGAVATILTNFNYDFKVAAYAGLIFYSVGIAYSHLSIGDPLGSSLPVPLAIIILSTLSYFFWKRK